MKPATHGYPTGINKKKRKRNLYCYVSHECLYGVFCSVSISGPNSVFISAIVAYFGFSPNLLPIFSPTLLYISILRVIQYRRSRTSTFYRSVSDNVTDAVNNVGIIPCVLLTRSFTGSLTGSVPPFSLFTNCISISLYRDREYYAFRKNHILLCVTHFRHHLPHYLPSGASI